MDPVASFRRVSMIRMLVLVTLVVLGPGSMGARATANASAPQGGHSAADLAKFKALVSATGFSARPQAEAYLVEVPGPSGRKWVVLTALSGPYVVGFTAVASPKEFTVSVDSLRALLRVSESVSSATVSLSGEDAVMISTAASLRLCDGEELKARLESVARTAERVHDALRPFASAK
jgi:hypothetical protein